MDDVTKLKADAYDIVAQIQQLQRLLDEKNKQIAASLEQMSEEQQKTPKTIK